MKRNPQIARARKNLPPLRSQRGIVLFVTLVAVLVLMIAGIALVRSFDSSSILSGNMAFKRDMVIQGERGMAYALQELDPGGALSSDTTRQSNQLKYNYSATILASDSNGIPQILSGKTTWNMTGSDINDTTSGVTNTGGIVIRYVIDRMCAAGTTTESSASCVSLVPNQPPTSTMEVNQANVATQTLYRISVRVTNTNNNSQTFLQSTGYL